MKEIFYKTYFGGYTKTISVLKRDDDSYSLSIAKYGDKSKHHFVGHFQFSLEEKEFKELISNLNKEISG